MFVQFLRSCVRVFLFAFFDMVFSSSRRVFSSFSLLFAIVVILIHAAGRSAFAMWLYDGNRSGGGDGGAHWQKPKQQDAII